MDVFEAIKERYSYRGHFLDKPIPRKDLKDIVQAGLHAPSGCNAQTTNFVIVDDSWILKQIGQMHTMKAMCEAKAVIACIIDKNPQPVYEGYSFQIEDCSAAVENMLLVITSLGYSSVWIDGWLRSAGRSEKIGYLLGVPNDKVVRVLLPIGLPQEKGVRKEKKTFEQRVWFNKYGGREEI